MRRYRRRLLRGGGAMLLAGCVCTATLHIYLGSAHAARLAGDRLAAVIGSPVRADALDVGWDRTTLRSVCLGEAEGGVEPWGRVEAIEADLAPYDLLGGAVAPETITLHGAAFTLHFDADGNLRTRLPCPEAGGRPWPLVRLLGGRLTIRQDGRPDEVIEGVTGNLRPENGRIVADGTVTDPRWGAWTLTGSVDPAWPAADAVRITLRSAGALGVTPALLKHVPIVSREVWDKVVLRGETPVELGLSFHPGGNVVVRYRVAMHVSKTSVFIAAIDLRAEQATGPVLVEDDVVRLDDVTGRTADGTLTVRADLDFRNHPYRLHFPRIAVEKVLLAELPSQWGLRSRPGRLTGSADLTVALTAPRSRKSGRGSGQVTLPGLLGALGPADVYLKADGFDWDFGPGRPK